MSRTYLLAHRALRNAGDYLIFSRARRLIATIRPDATLIDVEAWRPLAAQLDPATVRAAAAVIVCGGPGYANGMDTRYPLGLTEADPPLVLLALGSSVVPGTDAQLAAMRFDRATRAFIEQVAARTRFLGARDEVTRRLLVANGFDQALMTGDPAWYDLDRIDGPLHAPSRIATLAVTAPANPAYADQAIELFDAVVAATRPDRVTVVSHRDAQGPFVRAAADRGWDRLDIAGRVDGFATYDEHDAHVGYRVHAHLYALSRGRPSWLIAEDSRGVGVHETLGRLGARGFDDRLGRGPRPALLAGLPRYGNPDRWPTAIAGRLLRLALPVPHLGRVAEEIVADVRTGFPRHEAARATIRATYPTMTRMIESLP